MENSEGVQDIVPGGPVKLWLPGLGVTEAAELQDLAYAVEARQQQANDEDWRERMGLPARESLQERIREHMHEKAKFFKRHSVTVRARTPHTRSVF